MKILVPINFLGATYPSLVQVTVICKTHFETNQLKQELLCKNEVEETLPGRGPS